MRKLPYEIDQSINEEKIALCKLLFQNMFDRHKN